METLYRKVAVSERMPPKFTKILVQYKDGIGLDEFYYLDDLHCKDTLLQEAYFWLESIPDPTAQLKADKAELLEGLEKIFKVGYKPYRNTRNEELEIIDTARNLLSKFQKHKQ